MHRVVPSQVANFILQGFPWLRSGNTCGHLAREHAGFAAGLIELIDAIPDELIALNGAEYTEFFYSVAAIRQQLGVWQHQQNPNLPTYLGVAFRNLHPITIIHNALLKCPDQYPVASTAELAFISDATLREDLRIDISAVGRALSNGEWKAATVLAGSVLEALLLWALGQRSAEVAQVSQAAPRLPNKPLDEWHLPDYVSVRTSEVS
jgi:hypothetical protein